MRKFTLTIFTIIIFQSSFGQKNYLPGYIIQLNGDTLHGFIDYRNRERNPGKISFKKELSGEKTEFTPLNITAFSVLDEFYEGAIVETEISPVDLKELESGTELNLKTDTAFLQAMIKGTKSLYFYMNKFGKEQFYIKKDSSFDLLIYKKYLKLEQKQTLISENKKFIGQLTIYLYDCASIQKELKETEYGKRSLENLFLYYYGCINTGIQFQKKTEKTHVEFGVLGGLSLTKVKFRSHYYAYLVNTDYPVSVNFTAGIFLDIILPRNHGKWSVVNELAFASYKINGRYDEYQSANKFSITNMTLGYSYLRMNNMVRFKYPAGPLFIYINTGIANGYAIAEKNYRKTESTFYTIQTVEEDKAIKDTRKWEFGILIGLGTKFKRFSFEFRYETTNGMSDLPSLITSVNRYYFLLGFRF